MVSKEENDKDAFTQEYVVKRVDRQMDSGESVWRLFYHKDQKMKKENWENLLDI